MKNKGMLITAVLGMGTGAFLYSYCQKHPMKMKSLEKKVNDMMKDFK